MGCDCLPSIFTILSVRSLFIPLVAPVYEYGARSRSVYLPEGEQWYDFYTGAPVAAGKNVTVDAPYERMPLFVRGRACNRPQNAPSSIININLRIIIIC